MNPGDDIPMTEVEQSVTRPSAVRQSQPVSASSGRESAEIHPAFRESQSVTPFPAREHLENPSSVRQHQSVTTTPVAGTPQNPSSGISSRSKGGGESSNANPSAFNQIVLYDPDSANKKQGGNESHSRPAPRFSAPPNSLEEYCVFSVQCDYCFKHRLVPTKGQYEKIRANISQRPFVCYLAREWNRTVSCADPTDIIQDDTRIWATDKPDIPESPQGWERLIRLRSEGGTKFSDVYYVAPDGKKFRSTIEVQMYLMEHSITEPHISQFSFKAPKPLRADYVRKKPKLSDPIEVAPIAWARPSTTGEEEPISVTPISSASPPVSSSVNPRVSSARRPTVSQEHARTSSASPVSWARPAAVAREPGAPSVSPVFSWARPQASSVSPVSWPRPPPAVNAQEPGASLSVPPVSWARRTPSMPLVTWMAFALEHAVSSMQSRVPWAILPSDIAQEQRTSSVTHSVYSAASPPSALSSSASHRFLPATPLASVALDQQRAYSSVSSTPANQYWAPPSTTTVSASRHFPLAIPVVGAREQRTSPAMSHFPNYATDHPSVLGNIIAREQRAPSVSSWAPSAAPAHDQREQPAAALSSIAWLEQHYSSALQPQRSTSSVTLAGYWAPPPAAQLSVQSSPERSFSATLPSIPSSPERSSSGTLPM